MNIIDFNNSIINLVREINQQIDLMLVPVSEEYDLTSLQLKLILNAGIAKGPISIGQLGTNIGVTGGNISNICKKLEKKGFLSRNRSDEDERVVMIALSKKGRECCNKIQQHLLSEYSGSFQGKDLEALATIHKGLEDLNNTLKEINKEAPTN